MSTARNMNQSGVSRAKMSICRGKPPMGEEDWESRVEGSDGEGGGKSHSDCMGYCRLVDF